MNNFVKRYALPLLLLLGLATRFAFIWYPPNVVWDEQHFCNFTKGYIEKKYFFDIHPPLGKLILLGGLKLAGAKIDGLDCAIGNEYPKGYPYVASRVLPALAGSILPAVVYLFGRALTLSPAVSFFAASFVLLDNAVFAESRFALIDIFVPFFGFLGLIFFLLHRKRAPYTAAWWAHLALAALFSALALSVKWTGGGALFVMSVATFFEAIERKSVKLFFGRLVPLGVIVGAAYIALYAVHFAFLPFSGPGDAFMSERFKASLAGSIEQKEREDLKPLSFAGKFLELNKRMFVVNANQKLTHQDSSRFYEWPIGRKQIYFWVDKTDGMKRIYLRANPIVWIFGSATFFGSILYLVFRRKALQALAARGDEWKNRIRSLEFLLLIYFVNWLPFAAITRAMFLYHYFSSLIASLLVGAFIVFELVPALENPSAGSTPSTRFAEASARRASSGQASSPQAASGQAGAAHADAAAAGETRPEKTPSANPYIYWILIALAVAAFVLFSSLSYGYRPFFG